VQGGENVIGSYSRCGVPYHHAKYRTGPVTTPLTCGYGESQHWFPRIEGALAGLGHALDVHRCVGKKSLHGARHLGF